MVSKTNFCLKDVWTKLSFLADPGEARARGSALQTPGIFHPLPPLDLQRHHAQRIEMVDSVIKYTVSHMFRAF